MEIRPLTEAEQKYTYRQSMQIRGQTGSIGILRGGYGADHEFHSDFQELGSHLNTDEFTAELQEVLCSGENSILQNLDIMREFAMRHTRNGFPGKEYGFRVETENHAYLVRCNPEKESGNVEVHCYVKKWLDHHIGEAERGIRFIDSRYNELFRIADGEKITVTDAMGEKSERVCRYIDECHTEVGNSLYHICQFAEIMERNGSEYAPVEPEQTQAGRKVQDENAGRALELKTRFGTTEKVVLDVNAYMDNKSLYVGMTSTPYGEPEPYGDVTVNLIAVVPPYCAFVDTNNMPELERFLVENRLAVFTGLQQKSGCCTYPLYLFDAEKMRELCPDGMAAYEQENGLDKKPEKKEKSR